MVRARRTKRASEDQLYKDCVEGRDCPIDIKNKYENTTTADSILKWLSQFLWFGQLGIGTSRGTGGSGGYTRLGGGGGISRGSPSVVGRPPVVVDAIGPRDIVPIDAVDPTASSIVPLNEVIPTDPPTEIPTGEIEIIGETEPGHTNGLPDSVITGDTDAGPALIDVTVDPTPENPTRPRPSLVSQSTFSNPSFDAAILSSQLPGEFSATDQVIVTHGLVGEHIGGPPLESIELDTISEITGFGDLEIEEQPLVSTPRDGLRERLGQNFRNLRRRLYNRRVQQVPVTEPDFLNRPGRLVQFEYENPAYEADVSLEFERNINEVEEAPHYDFRDIVKLSRPETNVTDAGHVRLSRLGTRGTIVTRSGHVIGGQAHYYRDLSSIYGEEIELPSYNTPLNEAAIIHVDSTGTDVDAMETSFTLVDNGIESVALVNETELLDDMSEDFSNIRLLLTNGDDIFDGDILPNLNFKKTVGETGVTVNIPKYPNSPTDSPYYPGKGIPSDVPSIIFNIYGTGYDFILHPSLLPKKKKKYQFFF